MLVAREITGVGILQAHSPKSSVTSWLINMPQESSVPPWSDMVPERHPCYFINSPVFWALWFISYSSRKANGRNLQACVVSRLTISVIVNKQIMGPQGLTEI